MGLLGHGSDHLHLGVSKLTSRKQKFFKKKKAMDEKMDGKISLSILSQNVTKKTFRTIVIKLKMTAKDIQYVKKS